jgi:hypothetical protein
VVCIRQGEHGPAAACQGQVALNEGEDAGNYLVWSDPPELMHAARLGLSIRASQQSSVVECGRESKDNGEILCQTDVPARACRRRSGKLWGKVSGFVKPKDVQFNILVARLSVCT